MPPPFAGRLEMIGMGETRLEDAYGAAIEALEGFPLFTMTQALRLIGYFGDYKTGEWTNRPGTPSPRTPTGCASGASRTTASGIAKQEILYARTAEDQQRWRAADKEMIVAPLDRTEERVVRIVSLDVDDLADLARAIEAGSVQGNNDDIEDDDGADGVA